MITILKTEEEFNQFIKEGNVVVDFYASWCGPCHMLSPVMEEVAEAHPEIKFAKLDVDVVSQVASKFIVTSIPTLLFFKNETLVNEYTGFIPRENVEALIEKSFTEETYHI